MTASYPVGNAVARAIKVLPITSSCVGHACLRFCATSTQEPRLHRTLL